MCEFMPSLAQAVVSLLLLYMFETQAQCKLVLLQNAQSIMGHVQSIMVYVHAAQLMLQAETAW